jgi:hypothetical protein
VPLRGKLAKPQVQEQTLLFELVPGREP